MKKSSENIIIDASAITLIDAKIKQLITDSIEVRSKPGDHSNFHREIDKKIARLHKERRAVLNCSQYLETVLNQ